MSARDLKLYRLFQRVYGPIGERRQDYRMAMMIAHQCAKRGDTVEKFLPSFRYVEADAESLTTKDVLAKALNITSELTRSLRGRFQDGPLMTLHFKPGELRRINGNGGNSGD